MFDLMTPWKNIRLELSPTEGFPSGSVSRAYLLKLPLDDNDRVDREAVRLNPERATVRRHWASERDEKGTIELCDEELALRCGGAPNRRLELDGQPVRLGQQLAIIEADGKTLPFRVASIR